MKLRSKIRVRPGLTALMWIIAILLYCFSFIQNNHTNSLSGETNRVQKVLSEALDELNKYVAKALETPVDQWIHLEGFPDDMVIYKYNYDTLQSWVNLFPISNDEVDVPSLWYRLFDLDQRNVVKMPFAFLSDNEQYVNLGSKWYVTKVTKKGLVKIISGLEIKTDYLSENSLLENRVNKRFSLNKIYTTVPINEDDQHIIRGSEGNPLFSITEKYTLENYHPSNNLKWISLIFVVAGFFSLLYRKRSLRVLLFTLTTLTLVRFGILLLIDDLALVNDIFSPTLYADSNLFNSLGILLINHLYIFLMIAAIFLFRKGIYRYFSKLSKLKRNIWFGVIIFLSLNLITYIHLTLRSIILNSTIMLELYRLEEISVYTILIYICYALLFSALIFLLQIACYTIQKKGRISLLKTKYIILYTALISLYTLLTVNVYGFKKEIERNRVWSNKLAVERDLNLELTLREIEGKIATDPHIRSLMMNEKGIDIEYLRQRLHSAYFYTISQRYDVFIDICAGNSVINTPDYVERVSCFNYYDYDVIYQKGTQLANYSHFYYINDNSGKTQYVGAFTYFGYYDIYKLYFTISSRFTKEAIGYPSLLLDNKQADNLNIPSNYSYSKYNNDRFVYSRGRFNYPLLIEGEINDGYSYKTVGKYMHFYNKLSHANNIIIISRPVRSFVPYLVSFSYLMLFYGGILLFATRLGNKRKNISFALPKNSLRRKMSYLMTFAMIITLVCMGVGSVLFSLNITNENSRLQMDEKLQTVTATLSQLLHYAPSYLEINTTYIFETIDKTANSAQVDINLYDPHGSLIRSTRSEIFDKYLQSTRMNPLAFNELINNNKRFFINEENIAGLEYHSLYSAIYNHSGNLVAIINIPYFTDNLDLRQDASSMVAAIINVYILLLLIAFFGARAVSNSITKPLLEISKKMQDVDITNKAEPINYKNRDELGLLVKAYNEMLEDLDESSKLLAQTEREQAWREMARQIAHEIKNPLTPMRLSIQHLIRMKEANAEGWESKFDAVAVSLLEQIEILSETATEFSSFAKFYNEENSIIDLKAILNEQITLFDNRDNITFKFISEVDKAPVSAKKSQITRAFVNLISNAIQAIENHDYSLIRVTLSVVGRYYRIDIEDNGSGVSKENLNKLFKPNFTTKSGGTGLGLAICRSIVEQSNGNISYRQSELGGADFIIQLPIHNL